ncbi:MAG: type II toxin-antitoxin system RelE/ParE family toxin [Eubacterium sp.]|nr:type II toxin-antitoxin system RelE/ParE family toxin [Eubacterium sp.]
MRYEVKLTAQAIEQIEEIVQYISKVLLAPETARKWADALQYEIAKLDSMPSRYPLTEEEPWHTKGIHKMPFKNFLIYYLINEGRKSVWITAVIYGRRDQITALVDMSLSDKE